MKKVVPVVVLEVITLHVHKKYMGPGWVKSWQVGDLLHRGRVGMTRFARSLDFTAPQNEVIHRALWRCALCILIPSLRLTAIPWRQHHILLNRCL